MIDLTGKTAIITGGSRGIGRAIVSVFVRAGANVVFSYKTAKDEANSVIDELGDFAGRISSVETNLAKTDHIKRLVKRTVDLYGTIDILVNNAGIWTHGKIDEMEDSVWDETMEINLKAAFLLCRETTPLMKKKRSGRIINIASTAGQRGEAEHSHYAASKGGIISFTKSLASELGPFGIRTNCVAPGWVATDMTSREVNEPSISFEIKKSIPLGYIPEPEEIAGPVLFLASDLAKHINGEILNVNGGSVLCG